MESKKKHLGHTLVLLILITVIQVPTVEAQAYDVGASYEVHEFDNTVEVNLISSTGIVLGKIVFYTSKLETIIYDITIDTRHISPDTILVLEYNYTCNTSEYMLRRTLLSTETLSLTSLMQECNDLEEIHVKDLRLIAVIFEENQSIIKTLDLLDYLGENHSLILIKNYKNYWFTLEPRNVVPGWIRVLIRTFYTDLGDVEVVSDKVFNQTTELKLLLEPRGTSLLGTNVSFSLVQADNNYIVYSDKLDPNKILIITGDLPGIEYGKEYYLYIRAERYGIAKSLNLSSTIGPIVFVEKRIEVETIPLTLKDIGNEGLFTHIVIDIPMDVSSNEVWIDYTPLGGSIPTIMIAGLERYGPEHTLLHIYLVSESPLYGYFTLDIKKSDAKVWRGSVYIETSWANDALVKISSLQAAYYVLDNHVTTRSGPGDYTLVITANETITPSDILIVTVELNVTKKNLISPIILYPYADSRPVEGSPFTSSIVYLFNSTNPGTRQIYITPGKLSFIIPASYITRQDPGSYTEFFFTLYLGLENIENITITNISITKISIYNETTRYEQEAYFSPIYVALAAILVAASAILLLRKRYRVDLITRVLRR
ncbi:MAG: hypothetical protein GSR77_07205 [Desulfurococcales archaeon]|nr:hypothetical protein [Desulfurococcales archaeon]